MSNWRTIRMAAIYDLLLWKGPLPVSEMTRAAALKMDEPPPASLIDKLPWTTDGARSRVEGMVRREELTRIEGAPAHGKPGKPGYRPRVVRHWTPAMNLERKQEQDALLAAAYHRWPR